MTLDKLMDKFYQSMVNEPSLSNHTKQLYEELTTAMANITDLDIIIKYKLYSANYLRRFNRLSEAKSILDKLSSKKHTFSNELLYYFYRIKAGIDYSEHNFEEALVLFLTAEQYLRDRDDLAIDLYYSMGMVYTQLYKLKFAMDYLDKAISLCIKTKNEVKLCWCYCVKSTCYSRENNFLKAEEFLQGMLELASKHYLFELTGTALHNLAVLETKRNNQEKANVYYKKSLLVAERLRQYDNISQTSFVIAKYHRCKGDTRNALKYIERGLRWCEQASEEQVTTRSFQKELLAMKYSIHKDWEQYESLVIEMIDWFKDRTNYYKACFYAKELSSYYSAKNDLKKSLFYQQVADQYESKLGIPKKG